MKWLKKPYKPSKRVIKEVAKHDDEFLFRLANYLYSQGVCDCLSEVPDFEDIEEQEDHVKGIVLVWLYG